MTHTPGPWVWRGKSGSLHQAGTGVYAYGKVVLCPTYEHDSGTDTEVSEADARLIAAAPEMYEALVLLVAHTEDALVNDSANKAVFAAARGAIAKASLPTSDGGSASS